MAHENDSENRRLGDFEIIREIGRGGMGVVYEARQVSLNRKVALKVLSGGLGLTSKAVQRFHREAEAAAKLHHTNIVPVYATGEENGTHFYAMELIDGPSLDRVIRQLRETSKGVSSSGEPGRVSLGEPGRVSAGSARGADASPLANLEATGPYVAESGLASTSSASSLSSDGHYFDTVARMIAEVADALHYAHEQGVIHRDMKPSNLLLSPSGRLSVNDFGLARMLEQPGMTMTGEFVGTPAYMSPEQITAGRIPLDHRTDIYSLGATLYELLTLSPPFRGQSREQVLAQIVQKEPKAPRRIDKRVPVDLETICLKCLEKDPDRRYQMAGELAEDLRRYVNRFAISARRAGPVERLRKYVRRHPGLTAGVGLALVAIMVAGFFAVQSWRERQVRIKEKKQLAESLIFSGQFAEAEDAIGEAVELGVEEEWAQWRRGQIAFHSGEVGKAIGLLEPAVARMPDNQAANWLLAVAYYSAFDYQRASPIVGRFVSLPLSTAEDGLYKGFFQSFDVPKEGLQTLNEALPRQPALITHVVRAHVLARMAIDTDEPSYINKAMDDVTAAKTIQQGNALALAESVYVHHIAAIMYGERKQTDEGDRALRIAWVDVDTLKDFTHVPSAAVIRGIYLEDQGPMDQALQWYQTCLRQKEVSRVAARNYAWLLYERGKVKEARKVLEDYFHAAYNRDLQVAFMIAELDGGHDEALEICDNMRGEPAEDCILFRCRLYSYLGRGDRARELLAGSSINLDQYSPGYRALTRDSLDLFRNLDPAFGEKLLERDRQSRKLRLTWHMSMAYIRLGEHDRAGALQHFKLCVAAHEPYQPGFQPNRAFLKRMQKDPTWPPWIPAKKQ